MTGDGQLRRLCAESELTDDQPLRVEGDPPLVVVRHNGRIHATEADCPHQQAGLEDAEIADGAITCCLHFWSWRLEDGAPLESADKPLKVYSTEVVDGYVCIAAGE